MQSFICKALIKHNSKFLGEAHHRKQAVGLMALALATSVLLGGICAPRLLVARLTYQPAAIYRGTQQN